MKRIFTLLIGLGALTTSFAQYSHRDDYNGSSHTYGNATYSDHHYQAQDTRGYNDGYYSNDNDRNSYDNHYRESNNYERYRNDRNNYGRKDRSYPYEYDNRVYDRRESRSVAPYGREERYYRRDNEKKETLRAVGGGLIVGGILALIAGSH